MTDSPNIDASTLRNRASELAERFVKEETQFHLGFLPTEKSHPATQNFSFTIAKDTLEGIRCLLAVDADIPPVARRVFRSDSYDKLVNAMAAGGRNHNKICFSGCGSTGRLAVMLEAMWRQAWEDRAGLEPGAADRFQGQPRSGPSDGQPRQKHYHRGDRPWFDPLRTLKTFPVRRPAGCRIGLEKGDILIAMTEGGETPSVLGTLDQA